MPTPLPPATDYSGSSVTQGGKKTFMAAVIAYLTAAFGTDGTPSAVRTALGALSKAGDTMTGLLVFKKATDIASAATVNLSTATGNTVSITGTTGISAWTMTAGQVMDVIFAGILTLTHHATNNNLPGAANITTAAGDRARLYFDGTTVYVVGFQRANGKPVANPDALSTVSGSAPSYAQRAWVTFNGNTGAISASGNVSSVTRNGVGDYTIAFSTAMQDTNYATVVTPSQGASGNAGIVGGELTSGGTKTTSAVQIRVSQGTANIDIAPVNAIVIR